MTEPVGEMSARAGGTGGYNREEEGVNVSHVLSDDLDAVVGGMSFADGDSRHDLQLGDSSENGKAGKKKGAGFEEAEDGEGIVEGGADSNAVEESVKRTVKSILNVLIPYGGMLSTGFNLASTSIGAGILGLPAAFNNAGTIMATIYIVLITAETVYSMRLLAQVADKTGLRSFEEMGKYLLHPHADVVVAITRALHTYGGSVAYVVTIGDLLKPILSSISGTPEFLLEATGRKLLQTAFWLVFMFPLIFARSFNSLRFVSATGILFIVFFSLVVIVHCGMYGLKAEPRAKTTLFNTGNEATNVVGVFVFSYMCQIAALELYWEMRKRNTRDFTLCAAVSMTVCGVLYFLTGLFGYLDFGTQVKGSVLLHYNPIEEPQVFVSYIGIFIKICASFGLLNNACRCALFPVFGWDPKTAPYWKHAAAAVIIALVAFVLGIFVPNINVVFSLTGSLAGGLVGFILPALYMMYSGNWTLRSVGIVNYVSTYLVLIAGVVALVFGTAGTIWSLAG
ncbi:probable sodium-coupled neutral amino acid transporter 6 [Bactrocera neohumeralis]|uniref:probable sodium-coupled neutral amino acid transporter 6 n=1 Tax=Bactrocera neohumeralis TaxID=98809 RepID=UPI002166550A|nr:probable sodium-coupled neutral amino acid transporter 6 [Bactrocera neohumeralis]